MLRSGGRIRYRRGRGSRGGGRNFFYQGVKAENATIRGARAKYTLLLAYGRKDLGGIFRS
jgi:hypothetical protein